MNNTRKFALFLILFVIFSANVFAETLYSFSTNYFRISEQYPDINYGRDFDGISFIAMLNHYPENFFLGWFVRPSIGLYVSGFEWKGDDMVSITPYSSSDIRISAGPSYRLIKGDVITVPVSLGVSVGSYREEQYSSYYDEHDNYVTDSGFFEAINVGAIADINVVINPWRWFSIVTGLSASMDFLRWERGNMESAYRTISGGQFKNINYYAVSIGFYLGFGMRFKSPSLQN
jgi:hypothetical protein